MSHKYSDKEYQEILKKIELKKIGFLEIHSKFNIENYSQGEIVIDMKNHCNYQKGELQNNYVGVDQYEIIGTIHEKRVIDFKIIMFLAIESVEQLDDELIERFSTSTHKIITYPYLREVVQNLTSKMGIPPLILPLWTNISRTSENQTPSKKYHEK